MGGAIALEAPEARRGRCGAQYRPPSPRAFATPVTRVAIEIGAEGPARGSNPEDFAEYFRLRACPPGDQISLLPDLSGPST